MTFLGGKPGNGTKSKWKHCKSKDSEQSRASNRWYKEKRLCTALIHFALQVQAAFLAAIFLFRVRRLRINRGLTRRPSKKVEAEMPAKAQAEREKLQEISPAKNSDAREDVETCRPRKRSRPPATPQESGVLLELLRKRRLCK